MAHKKKEKAAKNNTASVLKSSNARHDAKADQIKSSTNPAKPSGQSSGGPIIWRKQSGGSVGGTGRKTGGGISVQPSFLKMSNFLNEVLIEYRKISWPSRTQVAQETANVLFLVLAITMLVWVFDLLVGKFVFSPLEHWGHLYGIGTR